MIVTDKKYMIEDKLLNKLDLIVKRLQGTDDFILPIDGDEGCLSGDTLIKCNRGKVSRLYNIKRLYNQYNNNPDNIISKNKNFDLSIPTYVRSFNNKEIRLHKIKNVSYSGKKLTYLLTLENGKKIKATSSHKFLTDNGWIRLGKLKKGNLIMCDDYKTHKSLKRKIKLYDIQLKTYYHPYSTNGRVEVHRLIYESHINNLSFLEYLDILLNDSSKSKKLKYINPKIYSIHHKDNCHYNNSIDNLELIKKEDHLIKYHYNNNYTNFSQGIPTFSKIKKIEELNIEDVYDIECEEPYHNFVANGIVVHNSGKTELAIGVCYYMAYKLKRKYDVDNIFFDLDKVIKFAVATEGQIIHFDEAALGLLTTNWQNKMQQKFLQLVMIARKKRHFIVLCIPKFHRLPQYIIEERTKGLLHVYTRNNLHKGRFAYFTEKGKNLLYTDWKKRKEKNYKKYNSFCRSFIIASKKVFTPEQNKAYEDKKDAAILKLGNGEEDKKDEKKRWMEQRNKLIIFIKDNMKLKFTEMEKDFKKSGLDDLSMETIRRIYRSSRV